MPYRRTVLGILTLLLLASSAPIAVAADQDMAARIAAAGDADKHNADAVIVVDWKDVVVRPNGIGTARTHQVTKILRDGAIRGLSVQHFPFDPHTNRLELVTVRVYRACGKVEEVPLNDVPKQPQTAWGIFWPTDQYLVTVPGLQVGDSIETITEMTGFNVAYLAAGDEPNAYGTPLKPPVEGHWHDEVHFWSTKYPIIEKRYSVRIPKDKPLQLGVYNGELAPVVEYDTTHFTYTFTKRDITPLSSEQHMEPWQNVGTKLLLATLPTWEDKARWLYEVSEPHFEADDAIRAKTAEIIKDCKTDEEKYTALNHWVAENIRYAGTSRGMCEGYTIHPSIETFHDRCGVCKDKAGMLVTMLRCAGYDSFLVMTMARQRVDPIPADQFNHAVTCIRWPDGSLKLLDPTWMPKSRDNWSTLEPLQHVVYGLPEGKELAQSPYFPPEECAANWKATTRIESDGDLTGAVSFDACGAPEGRLRRTLAGLHPSKRNGWFDATFQRISPNTVVTKLDCLHPEDFSAPLWIKGEFASEGYALGSGDTRYFKLPMLQNVFGNRALYDILRDYPEKERKYGLTLLATRLAKFEETIALPSMWKPVDLPETVDIDGPSASLHFEIEAKRGELKYTCELRVKHWLIPADEYENFKEVMDKFKDLAGGMIACDVEGAHAKR